MINREDILKIMKYHDQGFSPNEIAYMVAVDNMTWSFSRVNSFDSGCKWCWYKGYIEGKRGEGNVFAEFGSLVHNMIEDIYDGKLAVWDIMDYYVEEFNKITFDFPRLGKTDLKEIYFNQGFAYFEDFKFNDNWEILEVEMAVNTTVGDYKFLGYIDMVLRDKTDGKLIVLDHKSKAEFKKGELKEYARQLYLYAKGVYEKYGEYPKMLMFNRFRKKEYSPVMFKMAEYEEAQKWFIETIESIKLCREFPVTEDDFYLKQLCNHRNSEEHKIGEIIVISG